MDTADLLEGRGFLQEAQAGLGGTHLTQRPGQGQLQIQRLAVMQHFQHHRRRRRVSDVGQRLHGFHQEIVPSVFLDEADQRFRRQAGGPAVFPKTRMARRTCSGWPDSNNFIKEGKLDGSLPRW